MKKLLMLVVIALACTVGGGALASTASASNCYFGQTPISFNGVRLQTTFSGSACDSNTDLVEFSPKVNGTGSIATGIADVTTGVYHYSSVPPTVVDVLCGRLGVHYTGVCSWVNLVNLWGCGPVPQTLYATVQFRIHALGGNWGPWHYGASPNQTMNC